jgi:hypothetical protein
MLMRVCACSTTVTDQRLTSGVRDGGGSGSASKATTGWGNCPVESHMQRSLMQTQVRSANIHAALPQRFLSTLTPMLAAYGRPCVSFISLFPRGLLVLLNSSTQAQSTIIYNPPSTVAVSVWLLSPFPPFPIPFPHLIRFVRFVAMHHPPDCPSAFMHA